jgi:hypothetical protein
LSETNWRLGSQLVIRRFSEIRSKTTNSSDIRGRGNGRGRGRGIIISEICSNTTISSAMSKTTISSSSNQDANNTPDDKLI